MCQSLIIQIIYGCISNSYRQRQCYPNFNEKWCDLDLYSPTKINLNVLISEAISLTKNIQSSQRDEQIREEVSINASKEDFSRHTYKDRITLWDAI